MRYCSVIYIMIFVLRIATKLLYNFNNKGNAKGCMIFRRQFCSPKMTSNLIWIDMEMTGLNIEKDKILEFACIITDKNLNIIASTKNYIIHQPEDVLRSMNTWCMKTHDQSGLINACLQSKLTEKEVEDEVKKFLEQHTEKNQCPLAGNSVYMDKLFLIKYMPDLADFLHYRIVDVSTVKELCRRWNPSIFWKAPAKKLVHRALDDITESIEELKYYKKFMFVHTNEKKETE